ncbi:hypothetical protein AAHE18_08G077000 [Arachis hypogaea]
MGFFSLSCLFHFDFPVTAAMDKPIEIVLFHFHLLLILSLSTLSDCVDYSTCSDLLLCWEVFKWKGMKPRKQRELNPDCEPSQGITTTATCFIFRSYLHQ